MQRKDDELVIQVPRRWSRRDFLKGAGLVGLGAVLTNCAPAAAPTAAPTTAPPTSAPPAAAKTVMIQPWPGSYEDIYTKYVFKPFSDKYGVKISTTAQLEFFNIAKIKQEVTSGNPTLDLSVQLPGDTYRGGKDGLFEAIDISKVPNAANLFDDAKALLPYGVGYLVYSYGIGYRPGTGEYKSWFDLWDPKYKGRLSLGKSHTTYVVETVNRLVTGKMSPVDLDATFKKLQELKPNIKKMFESDADVRNLYNNKEIDAFVFFNGRVAVQIDDGIDIKFSSPKEGAFGAFDFWCITKGTKNKDLAHQFLDFALAPEQQKNIGQYLHYGPTNKTVTYEDPKFCAVMPCADTFQQLWFEDYALVAANEDKWLERWNEWLAG